MCERCLSLPKCEVMRSCAALIVSAFHNHHFTHRYFSGVSRFGVAAIAPYAESEPWNQVFQFRRKIACVQRCPSVDNKRLKTLVNASKRCRSSSIALVSEHCSHLMRHQEASIEVGRVPQLHRLQCLAAFFNQAPRLFRKKLYIPAFGSVTLTGGLELCRINSLSLWKIAHFHPVGI